MPAQRGSNPSANGQKRPPPAQRGAKPVARRRGRPPRDAAAGETSSEKLLDAAIDLFARYGYDPVSTGAIAAAADLTQSMVHYHFGSKEKLWKAAIDRLMRRRGVAFPVARLDLRDLDPVARLKVLIRGLVEANAAEPNHARIVMHEAIARTPRLRWLLERYIGAGFRAFDTAVEEAMKAGLIRKLPVHDVTNVITSAASLTFSLGAVTKELYGIEVTSQEHVRSLGDSVIAILFEGLQGRGAAS